MRIFYFGHIGLLLPLFVSVILKTPSQYKGIALELKAKSVDKLIIFFYLSPYPSVLDFWKIKLKNSSSTNWIFILFRTGFLLHVQPAKIYFEIDFCRLKIQLVELDFQTWFFKNQVQMDSAFVIQLIFTESTSIRVVMTVVGGWGGLKKSKTYWRNTWMAPSWKIHDKDVCN